MGSSSRKVLFCTYYRSRLLSETAEMSFEILKQGITPRSRLGVIRTPHGEIHTPAFMPIGTKGTVKTLSGDEVKSLGAEVILANTYHLWISGDETIAKAGGLHKFMNWPGPIMTDSGGFQLFSLGEKISSRPPLKFKGRSGGVSEEPNGVKITEEGVTFRDEISGDSHMLTPEKSVQIQNNLGSDIQVVLDEFTGDINNFEKVKKTVEKTTRWAKRARSEFERLYRSIPRLAVQPLQFGVVQGGMFE